MKTEKGKAVKFSYKNHRGEVAVRHVEPIEIRFGSTEWHLEEQWLLKAFDLGKEEIREFAIREINTDECFRVLHEENKKKSKCLGFYAKTESWDANGVIDASDLYEPWGKQGIKIGGKRAMECTKS